MARFLEAAPGIKYKAALSVGYGSRAAHLRDCSNFCAIASRGRKDDCFPARTQPTQEPHVNSLAPAMPPPQEARDTPHFETLCRVPDCAELFLDSGGSRRVEPALLGIILTRPEASPLPLGGLHE
jgi:hypothetical protein